MSRGSSGVFPCLVLFLVSTAAVSAQAPAGASATPNFKATAREVVVDVVVTSGKGDAVNGLHKEQFQVLENGKPQAVDFFEEHVARTRPAGTLPTLPEMPPNVYTNVPPAPQDDAVNVLLLDSLNTPPQMISYARNQILGYLNHVKPGTRIAIFALNSRLTIVQGFTADVARLREIAIKRTTPETSQVLLEKSESGHEEELESFLATNGPGAAIGQSSTPSAGGNGIAGAGWENPTAPVDAISSVAMAFSGYQNSKSANRTRMTLEAISEVARYLAAVPGRKNLIWFAGDFPVPIFPRFDQKMQMTDNTIPISQVLKAADLVTKARVAIYPVYAGGMMVENVVSADNVGAGSAVSVGRMGSTSPMGAYTSEHSERADVTTLMNQIASDTGGKAFYNTNDLDTAIGRSLADGSQYYTLVYSPENKKMDGQFRKIEVKVAGAKVKLSYRRGYNADEEMVRAQDGKADENPLRRELTHGMPNTTQILFSAHVVPMSPQPEPGSKKAGMNPALTGPTTRYSIDLRILCNDVKLEEGANGIHQGAVTVGLMGWDSKGKALNWEEGTQNMALKPETYASAQKSGIPAYMEVDLPNTDLYIKLGVEDVATGKTGTLEIPLHPAGAK